MIANTLMPFYLGLGGRMGSGKQWFPWVHLDDVTGIIFELLTNEKATGVYNAVAPDAATNAEFAKAFAGYFDVFLFRFWCLFSGQFFYSQVCGVPNLQTIFLLHIFTYLAGVILSPCVRTSYW